MQSRTDFVASTGRTGLWLSVTLLIISGLLLPGGVVGADVPIPTPTAEQPPQRTVPATGTLGDVADLERSSGGHPKLASPLSQLLETRRREGADEARAFAGRHGLVLDDGRVQVVIEATGGTIGDLREAVETLGGEYQTHHETLLQALVPIDTLASLVERSDVRLIREPRRPVPVAPVGAGTVDTEGLEASNAPAWHAAGYTGAGVRVAVIDAGFTDYADLLGSDLPDSVNTYNWTGGGMGGSEHGTACAEVVHDMAPGTALDLHKIGTDVDLGNAVDQAIADGADVISMSLVWFLGGPGDGTGFLADIVSDARSHGILYIAGAGNSAEHSWSGPYDESGNDSHLWTTGQDVNYFGPGDGRAWVIPVGFPIRVYLHWDDWTVVSQDYDLALYYYDGDSWEFVAGSENDQAGGYPTPEESISVSAPVEAPYGVLVSRYSATRDVCLRLHASHNMWEGLDERTPERSVMLPGDSPDAVTVGAVDVSSPYPLEPYSSQGPTFGPGGSCSGGSIKPDIAGYANVSTVSYGSEEFSGTSAATPHVAGAAALVKGRYPTYTVSQLQSYLEDEAIDLGTAGKDNRYGAGRLYLPYEEVGEPDIDVTPSSFDVTLSPGQTAQRTMTVANVGQEALTFDVHEVDRGFTPASTVSDDASRRQPGAVPNTSPWVGLAPVPPPEFEAAPMREPAAETVPSRTGLLRPPMDLSHLTGETLPGDGVPAVLPDAFDWRDRSGTNYVTPVRDQANCGSCYAFGAIGNLESKLLIDGAGTYDLSENNAKECNWREVNDFQFPSPGDYWGSCDGGNAFMMANLFSQKGTVLESCDPYQDSDVACKSTCPYQKTVLGWRLINGAGPPDPAVLKQYIYDHGPVITTIYADSAEGFNAYDGSYTIDYTTPGDAINHCVLIVGWSDDLPPVPGSATPAEGWIVKNSWGTSWGDDGYFYITYGAANIGSSSSFFSAWQDYDATGDVWYYDEDGWWNSFGETGGANTTAWGLAKFTAADDASVTRVEFWTADQTTDVDVYVYDNFDGTTLSGLRASELNHAFDEPGYHSVALDSPVAVSDGDDVVAVVKFTDATYGYPVVVDQMGPIETGRTYISLTGADGSWTDMGADLDSDVGIRVRTSAATGEDVPWLSEDPISGTVTAGDSQVVDVTFDATGLSAGTYTADVVIDNNDPDENPVTVPATLHVSSSEDPVVVTIEDGSGAPGSTGNPVTISADNQSQNTTPIGAAEFWVIYDGSVGLTLADVNATGRSSGFNADLTLDETNPSAVEAHILLYSGSGATIGSGTGPILELLFDVDASADPDDASGLSFSNALLSDELANPIPTDYTDTGQFTFGCAKDGDVNDNGDLNVFDLQILINMILHSPQPDPGLYASDWWCRGDLAPTPGGDEQWNVFDLQRLICLILGTCESGGGGRTMTGNGTNILSVGEVYAHPGTSGAFDVDCDNEDAIAAAELWLTYDSTIGVDVSDVSTAPRTDDWNVDFSLDDSDPSAVEVHILLYNMNEWTIDPGTGAILSVTYDVEVGASGDSRLDLIHVLLGDTSQQPLSADWQDGAFHIREDAGHRIYLPLVLKVYGLWDSEANPEAKTPNKAKAGF